MGLFTKKNMTMIESKDIKNNKIMGPLVGKIGMVVVAADWCGHCVRFSPDWIQFKKLVGNDSSFIITAVDAVKNPDIVKALDVQGFPTILDILEDGSVKQYKGERDIVSLVSNMCKRSSRNNGICIKM